VGSHGELIIDFSLYDAMMAGFEKVVFVIKEEMEADFRARMDAGAGRQLDVSYAFQRLTDLPPGYAVPEGRVKPWGTCHAVLAAAPEIEGAFAVINADDFYVAHAFQILYDYLLAARDDEKMRFALAGYKLANTLTENGTVARGVCQVDADGYLSGIDERLKIERRDGQIAYTEDEEVWIPIPEDAVTSMNLWGFTPSFLDAIRDGFPGFLDAGLAADPLKAEYLLPRKIDELLKSGRATVKVLPTDERWYGVTYREDKPGVVAALQSLKDKGEYPEMLW